jgi:hypothetical protein
MMVGKDRYTEADPDVLGALAQSAKKDLGTWRPGEAHQEVMLYEPESIKAQLVGQLTLFQRLLVQTVPVHVVPLERPLRLKQ